MIRFTTMFKKTVVSFVLIALFTAITPFHTAYAFLGGGIPGNIATEGTQVLNNARLNISTAMETISATANKLTAGFTGALQFKEFALDPLAWMVAKNLVSKITDDLVAWINSGFQGQPMFVNRLDEYILSELDSVAGQFLEQLPLGDYLCEGFEPMVTYAITRNYQKTTRAEPQASCTFTEAVGNLDSFLQGGWIEGGGSQGLREIAMNPQNTPYGAYLEAQIAFNNLLNEERIKESQTLSFGEGFLSQKVCEKDSAIATGESGDGNIQTGTDCRIVTPGQSIEEALTFQLSTGPRALITADEIDEIIGALLNQLLNKALEAGQGLLGTTGGSYSVGSSLRGIETETDSIGNPFWGNIDADGDGVADGAVDTDGDGVADTVVNSDNIQDVRDDISNEAIENQELEDPRITGITEGLEELTAEQEAEAKALTDEAEAQSDESQSTGGTPQDVRCESSIGCQQSDCPSGTSLIGTTKIIDDNTGSNADEDNVSVVWYATCQ